MIQTDIHGIADFVFAVALVAALGTSAWLFFADPSEDRPLKGDKEGMSKENNIENEPFYPFRQDGPGQFPGVSLRDKIALEVLKTFMSDLVADDANKAYEQAAEDAYRMADAMLKARER